jgi:hypothetical protein
MAQKQRPSIHHVLFNFENSKHIEFEPGSKFKQFYKTDLCFDDSFTERTFWESFRGWSFRTALDLRPRPPSQPWDS